VSIPQDLLWERVSVDVLPLVMVQGLRSRYVTRFEIVQRPSGSRAALLYCGPPTSAGSSYTSKHQLDHDQGLRCRDTNVLHRRLSPYIIISASKLRSRSTNVIKLKGYRDTLDLSILVKSLSATLTTHPRLLDTAKRLLTSRDQPTSHTHHTAL